jgi:hypothetical protein
MTSREILKLKPGDEVMHKHYNKSTVKQIMTDQHGNLFGVVIRPCYYRFRMLLEIQSGMHFNTPFVEDSPRMLTPIK